jgi:hypothetical protein
MTAMMVIVYRYATSILRRRSMYFFYNAAQGLDSGDFLVDFLVAWALT